jgi:hypothetical protein
MDGRKDLSNRLRRESALERLEVAGFTPIELKSTGKVIEEQEVLSACRQIADNFRRFALGTDFPPIKASPATVFVLPPTPTGARLVATDLLAFSHCYSTELGVERHLFSKWAAEGAFRFPLPRSLAACPES